MSTQPSNTTVVAPIVTLDGSHVFSNSKRYNQICSYFSTPDFSAIAADAECDPTLLAKMSEGATNYLRQMGNTWTKSVVVCKNAKLSVGSTGNQQLVLEVDVSTSVAIG